MRHADGLIFMKDLFFGVSFFVMWYYANTGGKVGIKNGIAVVVDYAIGLVIGFIFFVFVLCYFYRLTVADWFASIVCVYEVY